MKFVLNSKYDQAGVQIWIHECSTLLQKEGFETNINDWDNYSKYDIVIFMPIDQEIDKARQQNSDILIGLADPKLPFASDTSKKADFLIVSSIEQRDIFLKYNPNIFIYYPFPDIRRIEKKHQAKDQIIIGYHGNKIHLNSFFPNITNALEELGRHFKLELWVIYNIEKLGQWKIGLPDNKYVKTNHIQWSPENIYTYLSQSDIGIVPALMPIKNSFRLKKKACYAKNAFLESDYDYFLRYKYSSNPGRIYTFSQLGIPVVSDFFPSASQFIHEGYGNDRTGFIAYSAEGWFYALYQLASDYRLRQLCADNLYDYISSNARLELIINNFIVFLEKLKKNKIRMNDYNVKRTYQEPELKKLIIQEFFQKVKRKIRNKINNKYKESS